jgi:glycosyltransferase involved in cell wall biosynthesis
MKILWLTHFVPFPATGHGALQRTHQLLMRSAAAHDVGLIALAPGAAGARDVSVQDAARYLGPVLQFCDIHPLSNGPGGLWRILALLRAAAGQESFWEHWFYDRDAEAGLRRRIAAFGPDVVHLDSVMLAAYLPSIGQGPVVVTHHNVESDLYAQRASLERWPFRALLGREARKLAALEARLGASAAMNVLVSEADAARLRDLVPGARTSVVPNGVDTAFFCADAAVHPQPKSLVFVGGMDWYPNRLAMEWVASELWPELARDDGDRTMTVVGRQPPSLLLEAAANDSRLRVTGFVPDVRPYISTSSIYVCPIRVGGGTRLKILDALSMGRPLVSTALGVSGLELVEGTHYLRAETASEFVTQVARLDRDPALRIALGRNGRSLVEQRYSWSIVGRQLETAFSRAVETPTATRVRRAAGQERIV